MSPTAYVETSVISYLAAHPSRDLITAARQQLTHEWWRVRRPQFEVYISQLVLDESAAGDPEAAARRTTILAGLPLLDVTPAAVALARRAARHGEIASAGRGGRPAHRHSCLPWNGLSAHLELDSYRERRVAATNRASVSRTGV
jgi:hypothetical protein